MRYNEYDYLYASAYIHAREASLPDKAWRARLEDASDREAVLRLMEEAGLRRSAADGSPEEALDALEKDALDAVLASSPDPSVTDFLRYPADCHNAKTAIKCALRGRGEADAARLFDRSGAADPALLLEAAYHGGSWEALPGAMARAAASAADDYRRTRDPQTVDFALDRACFADMTAAAAATGVPAFAAYAALRADAANLRTAARVLHRRSDVLDDGYLRRALVPGGNVPEADLAGAFSSGDLSPLLAAAFPKIRPDDVEGGCGAALASAAEELGSVATGAETLAGYLLAVQSLTAAVRVKLAGLPE